MKKFLLLSLFIAAGCTLQTQPMQPPVTVKIDNSASHNPVAMPKEVQSVATNTNTNTQTTQKTAYAITPAYTIQDDYFGPAYGTVADLQYVQQPGVTYETQTVTSQYQTAQNQIPVPMYASQNTQNIAGQNTGYPQMMQNPNAMPYYPYAQADQNAIMQNTVAPNTAAQNTGGTETNPANATAPDTTAQNVANTGSAVVLQNPMTRELVRCDFADYNCIGSYESQGYIQLRAAPHFAGYNDIPSDTDYPPRRYRDNNNIPRW